MLDSEGLEPRDTWSLSQRCLVWGSQGTLGRTAATSGDESCNGHIQEAWRQERSGKAADQKSFDLAHEG